MKKLSLSKISLLVLASIAVFFMITNGKKWFLEGVSDARQNKTEQLHN